MLSLMRLERRSMSYVMTNLFFRGAEADDVVLLLR